MADITTTLKVKDLATKDIKAISKTLEEYRSVHQKTADTFKADNKTMEKSERDLTSALKELTNNRRKDILTLSTTLSGYTKAQKTELNKQVNNKKIQLQQIESLELKNHQKMESLMKQHKVSTASGAMPSTSLVSDIEQSKKLNERIIAQKEKLTSDLLAIDASRIRTTYAKQEQAIKQELDQLKEKNNKIRSFANSELKTKQNQIAEAETLLDKQIQIEKEASNTLEKLQKEKIQSLNKETIAKRKAREETELNKKSLKEEYQRLYENTTATNNYNSAVKKLNTMKKAGAIGGEKYATALEKEKARLKEATLAQKAHSKATGSATNTLVRHLRQVETLAIGIYALVSAYRATIGMGVELNKTIENNSFGLAALIATNTKLVDSQGEVGNGTDRFNASLSLSQKTMLDLKDAAKETSATFPELSSVFQQSIGFALKMGQGFGKTTQDIIDNTIEITSSLTNMGSAVGMNAELVLEEARSLFSGDVSRDSKLAILLFGTPTQANKAIKDAKKNAEDSVGAVYNVMKDRLKMFENLKHIDTYQRAMDKLKAEWQELMMDSAKPLFDDIKDSAKELLQILKENGAEIRDTFRSAYQFVKDAEPYVKTLIEMFVAYKGFQATRAGFEIGSRAVDGVKTFAGYWELAGKNADGTLKKVRKIDKIKDVFSAINPFPNPFTLWAAGITGVIVLLKEFHDYKTAIQEERKVDWSKSLVSEYKKGASRDDLISERQSISDRIKVSTDVITKGYDRYGTLEKSFIQTHIENISAYNKAFDEIQDRINNVPEQIEEANKRVKALKKKTQLEASIGFDDDVRKKIEEATIERKGEIWKIDQEIAKVRKFISDTDKAILQSSDKESKKEYKKEQIEALELIKELQKDIAKINKETADKKKKTLKDFRDEMEAERISAQEADPDNIITKFETMSKELAKSNKESLSLADNFDKIEKSIAKSQSVANITRDIDTFGMSPETRGEMFAGLFDIYEGSDQENDLLKWINKIESEFKKIRIDPIKIKLEGMDKIIDDINDMNSIISSSDSGIKKEAQVLMSFADITAQYQRDKVEGKENELKMIGQIAGASSALFEQGSREAAGLQAVQSALAVVEGATAVVHQMSSGDVYTAIPRAIAVAAMVATTLSQAGIAFGAGTTSVSSSYDAHASQVANIGTGSVLGDSDQASESISNSLSILEDMAVPQHRLTSQMADHLASIDKKIGGLSANILKAAGFAVGEGYVGFESSTGQDLTVEKIWGTIDKISPFLGTISQAGDIFNDLTGGITNTILGGLFGGGSSTSRTLADAGLTFQSQLIEAAIGNLQGKSYQTILTRIEKDGGWFGSDSVTNIYNTQLRGLERETKRQFELVLGSLYDTVITSGGALDVATEDVKAELSDFYVELGKISLKGKTGEEIQETLTNIFGKVGDEMALEAFPVLESFQKIGEGMFETLTRVSAGMEQAEYFINRLGYDFEDAEYLDIVNKQGVVSIEALTQSIIKYDESVYGANNSVVQMIDMINTSAEDVFETYEAFNDLRDQLSLMGQDATYLTSQMLLGAGGLEELSDAMSNYYENFINDNDKLVLSTQKMNNEFKKLNLAMPVGSNGFKDLVEGIDISTEAGQELYGRVLLLSDGFAELSDQAKSLLDDERDNALELASLREKYQEEQLGFFNTAIDAVRNLSNTFDNMINSIDDTIASLLGASDSADAQDVLIQTFWAKKAETELLLAKDGDLTDTESRRLQALIGDIQGLSTNIQNANIGDNTQITGELVNELSYLQNELNFDNQILKAQIVTASGQDIDVSTDGVLTELSKNMAEYNRTIAEKLTQDSTLEFSDFKAGGLLSTADEIAFRQSFQAESASTFSKELEDLRVNLAYLSLETVNTTDFLTDLSSANNVGYKNIIEFFTSMGEIPQEIKTVDMISNWNNLISSGDFEGFAKSGALQDEDFMSDTFEDYRDILNANLVGYEDYAKKYMNFDELLKYMDASKLQEEGRFWNLEALKDFMTAYADEGFKSMKEHMGFYTSAYTSGTFDSSMLNQEILDSIEDFHGGLNTELSAWKAYADGIKELGGYQYSEAQVENLLENARWYLEEAGYKALDGSHYSGLANVPFDGYRAELHKDERVLTARENRIYTNNLTSNNNKDIIVELRRIDARLASVENISKSINGILDSAKTSRPFRTKVVA